MSTVSQPTTGRLSGQWWPIAVLTSRGNVRQPMVYLTLAAMPASYFLVFSMLAGKSMGVHAFLGAALAFAVTGGVVSLPQTVVLYRMRRLHDMIVASPIRPLTYVAGLAVSRLLYVAPPLSVSLVAFGLFGGVSPWRVLALVPIVAGAWAFSCALGFALSRRWDNPAYISAVANMVGYLLVLLPPVYYPLWIIPRGLWLPVSLIPTAAMADLMRWVAGLAEPPVWLAAVQVSSIVAALVACLWYACRDTRWREP